MRALRNWRSHPVLRVGLPFIVLYSISLGMLVVNLGIIARQRVFLFPFLFYFLEAVPAVSRKRALGRPPPPHTVPSGPPPNLVAGPMR